MDLGVVVFLQPIVYTNRILHKYGSSIRHSTRTGSSVNEF